MSATKEGRNSRWLLILGWMALLGCVALGLLRRPAQRTPRGETIQFRNYAFTIRSARLENLDGRRVLIVALDVMNRARRGEFRFRPQIVHLVDRAGHERLPLVDGLRALQRARTEPDPCAGPIPSGTSCTTELVFDPPADLEGATLRLRFGGPLGRLINDIVVGRCYLVLGAVEGR